MKNKEYLWGILLVVVGVLGVLSSLFDIRFFGWGNLWPIFVLGPGVCFEFAYFSTRRAPGLLVPGGILTTLGLLFFFENLTGWIFSGFTWPVYLIAVAIGLFQLYWFGGRDRGLLIPVGILSTIAIVSFVTTIFSWISSSMVISILLVIVGALFVFKGLRGNNP